MFPRTWPAGSNSYTIEHIDLPTLGNLYLYWRALPTEWARRLESLLSLLSSTIWKPAEMPTSSSINWCRANYVDKVQRRFDLWDNSIKMRTRLSINGTSYVAGPELLEALRVQLHRISSAPIPSPIHGDLNFHNILYSERHGTYRLLDPNGGDPQIQEPTEADLRYEFAKLRYSYHGHFARISESIARISVDGASITATWLNDGSRAKEDHAMDEVLKEVADLRDLAMIEASILLSAPPLHSDSSDQQIALYASGVTIANRALGLA